VSWIFANGPQISEKINNLKRKVKACNFQIVPVSGIVNNEELNPFETFTVLKPGDDAHAPLLYHKGSADSQLFEHAENQLQHKSMLFQRTFSRLLRARCAFIAESENHQYISYLHSSGIAMLRLYQNVRSKKDFNKCRVRCPGSRTT